MVSPLVRKVFFFCLRVYRSAACWLLPLLRVSGGVSERGSDEVGDGVSAQRVSDGVAWADFCDELKAAGAVLFAPGE
jgi:hypothetical protein